jgi:hypothetical protein
MRIWDQQDYDLMQVRDAIYAALWVLPSFNSIFYYLRYLLQSSP